MSVTFTAGIYTIVLPNPTLGNSQQDNMQSYFREAMSGKVRGYKRTPKVTTLNINFVGLCTPDYINMLNFFQATAGESMLYTDNDGVIWEGYITNQPLEFVDNGNQAIDARQRHSFPITFVVPPRLWTPANIATEVWLDAADASTITQSLGKVSQWADKSGNDRHAIQATGSRQMSYQAVDTILNSKPSVYGIGAVGRDMVLNNSIAFGLRTIYAVFYYKTGVESPHSDHSSFINNAQDASIAHRITARTGHDQWDFNTGFGALSSFENAGAFPNGETIANYTNAPMPPTLWRFESSALRTQEWRVFGGPQSWTAWQGGFGEVIGTDGTEDFATKQKIEGYLAWKQATQGSLANGHPYKLAPPTGF